MKRLVALLALLTLALPAAAKDEFHLYNWNNYLAPETVKRFEEFCKCTVVQTYYSDNEELLAKLSAGAKGYDMYVPTTNAMQALIRSDTPIRISGIAIGVSTRIGSRRNL